MLFRSKAKIEELETEKNNLLEEIVKLEESRAEQTKSPSQTQGLAQVEASPSSSATITDDELAKLKADLKRVRTERNQLKVDLQTAQYELAQNEDDRNDERDVELEGLKKRVSQLSVERANLADRVSGLEETCVKGHLNGNNAGGYRRANWSGC